MLGPAADYERLLEDARRQLRGGWTAQGNSMVERWLHETDRNVRWLRFAAAFLTAYTKVAERDGVSGAAPMYVFEPEVRDPAADEVLRLRAVTARARMSWPERLDRLLHLDETAFAWVVEQVSAQNPMPQPSAGPLHTAIAKAFQRKLIEAVVDGMNKRKEESPNDPPPLIVIQGGLAHASPASSAGTDAQNVDLTITQAFEAWRITKRENRALVSAYRNGIWPFAVSSRCTAKLPNESWEQRVAIVADGAAVRASWLSNVTSIELESCRRQFSTHSQTVS